MEHTQDTSSQSLPARFRNRVHKKNSEVPERNKRRRLWLAPSGGESYLTTRDNLLYEVLIVKVSFFLKTVTYLEMKA